MFFSKKGGLNKKPSYGRLYVLRITLRCGKRVHKVGMTHSDRSTDRMLEILRSFFNTYRYVPMCELRKDKEVLIPLLVERHFHDILDEWSYTFDKKFDGCTEFFENLDEDVILEYLTAFTYNDLLVGKTTMKDTDLQNIRKAIAKTTGKLPKPQNIDKIPF